jgi:phytoene desaturase
MRIHYIHYIISAKKAQLIYNTAQTMKITVIGGGISGLATAALLAKDGHQVTLLEKNTTLGGRARIFTKKGFTFDMGPSWYMMPEVFETFFNHFGYTTSDFYTLTQLDPKYRVYFEGQKAVNIESDFEKNSALFEEKEPGSSAKIRKLLKKTAKAYDLALTMLYQVFATPLDLLQPQALIAGLKMVLLYNQFSSYHHLIKKYVSSPQLQQMLEFHTVFLGGTPFNTPALYSILTAADFEKKIWYPQGGIIQLIKALTTLCKKYKVIIKTNSPVTGVKLEANRITDVLINKQKIATDLVVNTIDYAYFDQKILPSSLNEYTSQYWNKKTYTVSCLLLYLGLNKKIPQLKHHTFYFQENWSKHLDQTFKDHQLPKDPCYYICTPSKTDTSVAPPGMENLFVLIPIGVDNPDASEKTYVTHVLNHMEKTLNTSIKEHIVTQTIYSQKDFMNDYNAHKGNAFGIAHTLWQSVFLRPRMRSSKVANLWHAGHYTQPGVGMPMAIISAQLVHKQITKLLNHV